MLARNSDLNLLSLHESILKNMADNENTRLFFLVDVTETVEKYKQLLKKPIFLSFVGADDKKMIDQRKEREDIMTKYLFKIKKYKRYLPLNSSLCDFRESQEDADKCEVCGCTELLDDTCTGCGMISESFTSASTSYNDARRITINSKYKYNRIIHFKECLAQFQGKESVCIDAELYEKLDKKFEKNHLLVESEDAKLRYSKILKEHIYIFLKQLRMSKYYDNINLIYAKVTGKSLPNLAHIENAIIDDFTCFASLYDKKIKEQPHLEKKKNTQYVLYQLLHRHNFLCKSSDFGVPRSVKRFYECDEISKWCFKTLGWNIVVIE